MGRLKKLDSVSCVDQTKRLAYAQMDSSFIYGHHLNEATGTFTNPLKNFGPHKRELEEYAHNSLILGLQLKGLRKIRFLYV